MLMVFLLQLIIPLLMLLSLALARPSNKAGLMLKMFAIGAWLLAIDLTGLWTALPWWTPRVLLIAAAVTATWRYGRSRRLRHRQPIGQRPVPCRERWTHDQHQCASADAFR